jgi:hypothetical protein
MEAVRFGRVELVRYLLQHGADGAMENPKGYSLLSNLMRRHEHGGNEEARERIAELSIQYGALEHWPEPTIPLSDLAEIFDFPRLS